MTRRRIGRSRRAARNDGDVVLSIHSVVAAIVADETAMLELPHVVYIDDPYTHRPSAYGPFRDAVLASVFADRLITELLDEGYTEPVMATVVPLEAV